MNGSRLLFQLFKITVGFIAALLACSFFLTWGFFKGAEPHPDPVIFATIFGTGLVSASVIGAVAFLPSVFVVAVMECLRLRSILMNVAAGGAIAFILWTFGGELPSEGARLGSTIALAAGFIAGGVYWVFAGRTAGCWLQKASKNSEKARVPDQPS